MKFYQFAMFAAALYLASCASNEKNEQKCTVVTVSPAAGMQLSNSSNALPGVVKEAQNVKVAFKSAGQLNKIYVKEGDYVRKGQLLATLDAADYQIGLDAATAQYNQLKSEVGRIKQLYERGSVSANEYEKAQAGLQQVEAQLKSRQNQVDYTRVSAPVSGYIETVYSNEAEMVDAGTPVLSIIDDSNMQIEANLPFDLYERRNDMSAFVADFGDQSLPLALVSVAPKTDGTQMYKMLLSLPSSASLANASGRNVTVRFALQHDGEASSQLRIPLSAVFYDAGQPCAWVVEDGDIASKRQISLGQIDENGDIEVLSGLSPADRVVKAGVSHLHQGQQVEVLDRNAKTNVGGLL